MAKPERTFTTDAGTGEPCRCGHGADLHELMDLEVEDDHRPPRIRWRFKCGGVFIQDETALRVGCSCNNMRPL